VGKACRQGIIGDKGGIRRCGDGLSLSHELSMLRPRTTNRGEEPALVDGRLIQWKAGEGVELSLGEESVAIQR